LNDTEPEALESQLNCPGILRNKHLGRKPLLQDIIFFGQPEAEHYYDPVLNEITAETSDHEWLIELGGRPMCRPSTIPVVAENRHQFTKLTDAFPGQFLPLLINKWQLQRWLNFRLWQDCTRGRSSESEVNEALWVRKYDRLLRRKHTSLPMLYREELAALETDEGISSLENIRKDFLRHRSEQRAQHKMGFEEWCSVASKILAERRLALTSRLDEDPKKQDTLTTWLEYFAFEIYSETTNLHHKREAAKQALDGAWNKLLASPHFSGKEKAARYTSAGLYLDAKRQADEATEALVQKEKQMALGTKPTRGKATAVEIKELEDIMMVPNKGEELQDVVLELLHGLRGLQERNQKGKGGLKPSERARHRYLRDRLYELQLTSDHTFAERKALEVAQERLDIVTALSNAKADIAKMNRQASTFPTYTEWMKREIPCLIETERTGQRVWQFPPIPEGTRFAGSHEAVECLNLPTRAPEISHDSESPAESRDDDDESEDSESESEPKPTARRNPKKRDRAHHSYDESDQDFREPKRQKKRVVIRTRTPSQRSKHGGGRSSGS
jgi:hypothetical protein